jgi:hypothetical protein
MPVCRTLNWSPDSIERMMNGLEPSPLPDVNPAEGGSELQARVAELAAEVADLAASLAALSTEVGQLRAQLHQPAPDSV